MNSPASDPRRREQAATVRRSSRSLTRAAQPAAARRQALAQAGVEPADATDTTALALRDKTEVVEEEFAKRAVLATGTYKHATTSRNDWRAHVAGEEAARAARLGDEKDLDG